ncbi:hypothetical protein P0F65_10580 [Sphingomonas sp. I4]
MSLPQIVNRVITVIDALDARRELVSQHRLSAQVIDAKSPGIRPDSSPKVMRLPVPNRTAIHLGHTFDEAITHLVPDVALQLFRIAPTG